jgi:FixJ family two-component response regulator
MQRVGIIDDDDRVRLSMKLLLEVSGLEVETFASAEEFLGCQNCLSRFACLIVDFRLPGLNGLDLVRTLREQQVFTPTVISSGFTSESEDAEFVAAGVAAVLNKPVQPKQLLRTIKDVIALGSDTQGSRCSKTS